MKAAFLCLLLVCSPAQATAAPRSETAVLAGGCFWGMEMVFEHVKGVTKVLSGYAGGKAQDASYARVSSEASGHAEAVKIIYDPAQVSYAQLLKIYFTVAHDPTEIDRQGPDAGHSYRSAIFPQSANQERFAKAFIGRLNGAHFFKAPIATRIESGAFYPAESFHQGFARKHPDFPYIVVNDRPKLVSLEKKFPALYKA